MAAVRHFPDWLQAYVDYAGFTEAPQRMHFWAGVSAVAGALRRRVWIDMAHFKWYPNHYIVIVAPPGIVSKSTTASIAMDLLRKVPGIMFGPDVVTWPALVSDFAQSTTPFEYRGEWLTESALTLESSEFGNLVNPQDREMIDLMVNLWDSKQGNFTKKTKGSGTDVVENPWINLIACTTPAWIAGNFPEYVIGGGFTSRVLFVYAEEKEKLVAYPHLSAPKGLKLFQETLIADLTSISELVGPFTLTDRAIQWGTSWYEMHYASPPEQLRDDRFGGYLARKQTHLHKLAMVLSASRGSDLVIDAEDLFLANKMISELEEDMPKVFSRIGRSEDSIQTEKFIRFVQSKGSVPYQQAYAHVHAHFTNFKDFEGVLAGAIRAGLITLKQVPNGPIMIEAVVPDK